MSDSGLAYGVVKRIMDVVVAAVALLILIVPMIAIALAVWLQDPRAPILFGQRRCGRHGRDIRVLKFRTMVRNADELKDELRSLSVVPWPDFRVINDPRVTPVGRFLRQTSLDELPQFINVLRGDMSLVGPRPTSFAASTYALWETGRLDFRPGITGPWQVWGRSTMDFEERCRLEIRFFREPSILAELWILLVTIRSVAGRTGVC